MLRWRLFGISFCIQPSFWIMNALWAYILYQPVMAPPQRGQLFTGDLLMMMGIWILCTLVSVMAHELGHVITGRIFGQPGNITLTGLGGQAVGGYEALRVWQRILVILAGPCAGFAFFTLVVLFDGSAWNFFMNYLTATTNSVWWLNFEVKTYWIEHTSFAAWRWNGNVPYALTIGILTFLNLFVNVMNLLPIIPMDGGMIFKEICCLASPRHGLKFAFGTSFVMACAMALFYLDLTLENYNFLEKRLQRYYPFGFPELSLLIFISLAYQCFQAYRQLAMQERHMAYREDGDGDDDMSDPRHLPYGVKEVPVKDPRDFAPPAPGSETPRR